MLRASLAGLLVSLSTISASACSHELPVTPSDAPALVPTFVEAAVPLAQAIPGQYDLDFEFDVELILHAHVSDFEGTPAAGGSVHFQYCSYKGGPPNDIESPDEAPSSACADGSGTWANVGRVGVDAAGDASLNFGVVSVVDVIGFRYRYVGQGSGIANWTTEPEDWTR